MQVITSFVLKYKRKSVKKIYLLKIKLNTLIYQFSLGQRDHIITRSLTLTFTLIIQNLFMCNPTTLYMRLIFNVYDLYLIFF
jgi:hypothetical protein